MEVVGIYVLRGKGEGRGVIVDGDGVGGVGDDGVKEGFRVEGVGVEDKEMGGVGGLGGGSEGGVEGGGGEGGVSGDGGGGKGGGKGEGGGWSGVEKKGF